MLAMVGLVIVVVDQDCIGVPNGDQSPLMRTISLSNCYLYQEDVGSPQVLH